MSMFNDGSRLYQDRFDTRRLADRIDERLVRDWIDDDRTFIEGCDMVFVATADAEGQPQCSYKVATPASSASSTSTPSRSRTTTATACSSARGTRSSIRMSGCCSSTSKSASDWARDVLAADDPANTES